MKYMEKEIKTLTIGEAERAESSSVWVLNISDQVQRQKGRVLITVVEGNGSAITAVIPVTFIPIDLTTQATKSAILMSPNFRKMSAQGYIALISEETAMELLSTDRAKKEQRRIFSEVHGAQDVESEGAVTGAVPTELDYQNARALESNKISGFAMNIAHTGVDANEDNVVSQLELQISSMSTDELRYIVSNSVLPKVKAAAASAIVN